MSADDPGSTPVQPAASAAPLPARTPTAGPAPAPAPAPERPYRRWGWPAALLGTLALVLGVRLFLQWAPPGAWSLTRGVAGAASAASAASGAAPGSKRIAPLAEPSPQLVNATETAARVARATTAALSAVTQLGAASPPPERTLELCGLGRLTVRLPPPPPPGNAAARSSTAAAAGAGPGSAQSSATAGAAAETAAAPALAAWPAPPVWAAPEGLPPALGDQARADVWPALLAALEAPAQPLRARAAAQLLRASGVVEADSPAPVSPKLAGPKTALPAAPQAQATQQSRPSQQARKRAVAALARLARPVVRQAGQSPQGDATVLRWALALCAREPSPGAECRRIGPRDLVRLAPEDSASWLALAAQSRVSASQRQTALDRAAAAPQFTALGQALAVQVAAAWPAQRPGFVQVQVLALAQAVERGLEEGTLPAVMQACSEQALAGPPVPGSAHARCEALGRQMVARGPDLAWLSAGAVLGQRLGWPEPERRALRREEVALLALQAAQGPVAPVAPAVTGAAVPAAVSAAAEQPLSCPVLARNLGRLQGQAQAGELAWLRQARAQQSDGPASEASAGTTADPPTPEAVGGR